GVATWVSTTTAAAGTRSGSVGSPKWADSSTSIARKRLPPAASRYEAASVNRGSLHLTDSRSNSSTCSKLSCTSRARVGSTLGRARNPLGTAPLTVKLHLLNGHTVHLAQRGPRRAQHMNMIRPATVSDPEY